MSQDKLTDAVMAQQLARVTLRAHSAELMLYSLGEALQRLRADVDKLADDAVSAVTKLHELNEKYPLGDGTPEGVRTMLVNALRTSVPGMAGKSDADIIKTYKL